MVERMLPLVPALAVPVVLQIVLYPVPEGSLIGDILVGINGLVEGFVNLRLFDESDLCDLRPEIFVGAGSIVFVQTQVAEYPFPLLLVKSHGGLDDEVVTLLQTYPSRTGRFIKIFDQQRIVLLYPTFHR